MAQPWVIAASSRGLIFRHRKHPSFQLSVPAWEGRKISGQANLDKIQASQILDEAQQRWWMAEMPSTPSQQSRCYQTQVAGNITKPKFTSQQLEAPQPNKKPFKIISLLQTRVIWLILCVWKVFWAFNVFETHNPNIMKKWQYKWERRWEEEDREKTDCSLVCDTGNIALRKWRKVKRQKWAMNRQSQVNIWDIHCFANKQHSSGYWNSREWILANNYLSFEDIVVSNLK